MSPAPARAVLRPYGPADLVKGARSVLDAHLEQWRVAYGLPKLVGWVSVPTQDSLKATQMPSGTITCPGLVEQPTKRAQGWSGKYRLGVGVYVREDGYDAVQQAASDWLVAVRSCILAHPTLGLPRGVVSAVDLAGEDTAVDPDPQGSQTEGGMAVAFDVTVVNFAPAGARPAPGPGQPTPGLPTVAALEREVRVLSPDEPLPNAREEGSP